MHDGSLPRSSVHPCFVSLATMLVRTVLAALCAFFTPFATVMGAPSAASIGSDLTFLFQNDLNWTTAPDHNGTILLSTPLTNTDALAACAQLNEPLLQTNGTYFASDMRYLLSYLGYLGNSSATQQYWVTANASNASEGCTAILGDVIMQSVSCDETLPAFCAQSAPYRPNNETDMSPAYYVEATSGNYTFTGTRDHLSFRFIGIPYADPFERWTYSAVYGTSGATVNTSITALEYGSPCTQVGYGSEDCLYLNIQTPYLPANTASPDADKLKPVMFWIHGGAYETGEGSDGIFDGGNKASRGDVVTVTINYRLSTLGFLALEDGVANGNYGLADQITALRWVQAHIAAFGGDPSRVTIHGQSAGATSVRALLASPVARGESLFAGAIAQSSVGGFASSRSYADYYTIPQEVSVSVPSLLEYVGCNSTVNGTSVEQLACLKTVNATVLVNAPNPPAYVIMDGTYITSPELDLSGPSSSETLPHVIFGWMRDDGADVVRSWPSEGETSFQSIMSIGLTENETTAIVNSGLFPVSTSGTNITWDIFNASSRVATDGEFRCIDQATMYAAAKNHVFASVHAYQFERSYMGWEPLSDICDPPATADYPYGDPSLPYYRCHSGELFYTAGTLGQSAEHFRDTADWTLSQVAVDYWTSFARSFDPNPDPAYMTSRGYTKSAATMAAVGPWNVVSPTAGADTDVRMMDIPLKDSAWIDAAQCYLLGYGIDYYL
ncbi:cholinesterase [Coniophora puteana RWD-64-598 SS2]|uniref:Cholinesterase n=1 Tax=Coniophora puteana (strain RWD-64-598) TaxID=741705 RepID=A0A5M3MLY7_CONPW|nr:cholinesterase [Coniophora puteana RWD-64-598 SS2]EIW80188.1 cholinesterase [Coniophora puteana RWD-64-598 SS2]